MQFFNALRGDDKYYLPLLLFISILLHFPFVFNGFGELDAARIAVSVIDMINNGSLAAFANFYFTDVIPLYILYLKLFMRLFNYNYSYLPIIMNYTNAVIGTLIIIPAFLLIKNLFNNPKIAFCVILVVLFAPSFYQSTIMGFPHLISLFFLIISFLLYLSGIGQTNNRAFLLYMFFTCIFLTIAFLFKSDYILATGFYIGLLLIRKINNKIKIITTIIIIIISGILFLVFRKLILGPTGGTTMSSEEFSKWYHFFITIPVTFKSLYIQVRPVAYAFGMATFFLSPIALLYLLYKKRFDVVIFVLSWAALPTIFWIFIGGNNARHNMLSVLPVVTLVIWFFYERFKKGVVILAVLLILANYFILHPSFSILRPSGNLLKSNFLIKERMLRFQADARKIASLDDKKIAVIGYFHNPHVIFEILSKQGPYKAQKIGREDYRIEIDDREFVFIYFILSKPDDLIPELSKVIKKYNLYNYTFVSATYDLTPLKTIGLKVKTVDIIPKGIL